MSGLGEKRVLLVGAGGLGSAAALVLARAGLDGIDVIDDDVVDETNLHRQTLYVSGDVGRRKAPIASARIEEAARRLGYHTRSVSREIRLTPDTADGVIDEYDLILEGSDNFASKFLTSDVSFLRRIPVVQAGAVRWSGWALASLPGVSACLRCVFEDIPSGPSDSCAEAGVVGPVVGALGAIQAALALRVLTGDPGAAGVLWSYEALTGRLRRSRVARRVGCPLCEGRITDTELARYLPPECAA